MTAVVLAIAAAVAVVAAVLAFHFTRRARAAQARAESRADGMVGMLEEAAAEIEKARSSARAAEVRAGAAEERARNADSRARDAEKRSGESESRVAEAMRRAEEANRRADLAAAAAAGSGGAAPNGPAAPLLELERLRVEREWRELAGPDVELPVPWDGSLAAVVATELAVIREVMGTPSRMQVDGTRILDDRDRAAIAIRSCVEMLRALARSGEEMEVSVGPGGVTVTQRCPDEPPDEMSIVLAAARSVDLPLRMELAEGLLRVSLTVA